MTKSVLIFFGYNYDKTKDPQSLQVLALFGMTSRTLDCPITGRPINAEIRVAGSQLDKRILL